MDANANNCAEAEREGLRTVHGDALDEVPLLDASIEEAGLLIGMTPNAEVNVLVAKRATEAFMVPEVYALLTREEDGGLFKQLELAGARPLFTHPVNLLEWDRKHFTQQAETLIYTVRQEGTSDLEDARALPLTVRRGDDTHLFGSLKLQAGDEVFVLHYR